MEVFTGTFNKDTTHRCSTCNIVLTGETEYKEHYKTEFHRYNLEEVREIPTCHHAAIQH